jgi:hypothetical protein
MEASLSPRNVFVRIEPIKNPSRDYFCSFRISHSYAGFGDFQTHLECRHGVTHKNLSFLKKSKGRLAMRDQGKRRGKLPERSV